MPQLPELNFKRMPVTLILMAVIVAIELICTFDPGRRDFYYIDLKLGMLSLVWDGELWRPFTTTLLHGNFIHAAFNVYWLAVFGGAMEPRLGSYRFLGVVVLLAYVSTMPQFLVTNFSTNVQERIVGFSGVGYGLFGMLWIGRRWRREFAEVCDDATVRLFFIWFLFCIVATRLDIMPVANIAHGSGCAFGALYGMALFKPRDRSRWIALAVVATALVLATLIGFPGHRGYENIRDMRRWNQLRQQLDQLLDQNVPPPPDSEQP